MATDRTSYQKQYYRKPVIWSQKKTIKNLREDKKKFMESPEGIAYKKRLLKESGYQEKYREKNKEKIRAYQKEYHLHPVTAEQYPRLLKTSNRAHQNSCHCL